MITYTITQSEYDQLIKLANKIICAGNGNLPGNSLGNDLGRDVIAMLCNLQPAESLELSDAEIEQAANLGGLRKDSIAMFRRVIAAANAKRVDVHPAPQQKPLTDEQIDTIDQSMCGEREFIVPFARAIEAAHNIKG